MKPRIMYIELKSGPDCDVSTHHGPARIGRASFSKTGSTIYYKGRHLQRAHYLDRANYRDIDTGDEYWVSGCKKNGEDRHQYGGGPVEIDDDVREEYWTTIRNQPERMKETVA